MDNLIGHDSPAFVPHRLHGADRSWPETNCYVDLWIELLCSLGYCPEAAFGFAVSQDYEVDQFTFSKIPTEDLRRLYGLETKELSIYRSLEDHVVSHVGRRDIVLIEVDAFYLPDTAATTYRSGHTKTTIAIDAIDADARTCQYFHNAARGSLAGDDYLGIFRLKPEFQSQPDLLAPYVEIVNQADEPPAPPILRQTCFELLREHMRRRSARNPFELWKSDFPSHLDRLLGAPQTFHDYAFHFPRLAGANFELLGSHLAWLDPGLSETAFVCGRIAQTTKILQFRLARSAARRRPDPCTDCLDQLQGDHDAVIAGLSRFVSS
jgi:hypothetical protein